MTRYVFALTVDTDPDGLAGQTYDRENLSWKGVEAAFRLTPELREHEDRIGAAVPITWFIRADGQLESRLGNADYLLETFADHWDAEAAAGNVFGWHPHLYRQGTEGVELITDPTEASDELERLWSLLGGTRIQSQCFRNGEGWHTQETLNTVERLGFTVDSSAIPGRQGEAGHPMNWIGAPNEPYFPETNDPRIAGAPRKIIEMPMTTWRVKAPWDQESKLRYMNPAIHHALFAEAVDRQFADGVSVSGDRYYVLMIHADEVLPRAKEDGLFAFSRDVFYKNLKYLTQYFQQRGDVVEFVTLPEAANRRRAEGEGAA